MKCPVCHLDNQDDARFCCHCGNVISGESLAVTILEASNIIGCKIQIVKDLIKKGCLTPMGNKGLSRYYVSRESLMRFCDVIPDFKDKTTAIKELNDQLQKAQKILEPQVSQINSDALFSKISIRNNIVHLMMDFCLTRREKRILIGFFFEHKTLEELSGEFDITRERVRQIKETAIKKLSLETLPDNITYELQQYEINHYKENEYCEDADEDEDDDDEDEDIEWEEADMPV